MMTYYTVGWQLLGSLCGVKNCSWVVLKNTSIRINFIVHKSKLKAKLEAGWLSQLEEENRKKPQNKTGLNPFGPSPPPPLSSDAIKGYHFALYLHNKTYEVWSLNNVTEAIKASKVDAKQQKFAIQNTYLL